MERMKAGCSGAPGHLIPEGTDLGRDGLQLGPGGHDGHRAGGDNTC